MNRPVYSYTFEPIVDIKSASDTLILSTMAAEGIHGYTQVRLDAIFRLAPRQRTCVIEAATPVGRTIALIFTRLLTIEFGDEAFHVERVVEAPAARDADAPRPCR